MHKTKPPIPLATSPSLSPNLNLSPMRTLSSFAHAPDAKGSVKTERDLLVTVMKAQAPTRSAPRLGALTLVHGATKVLCALDKSAQWINAHEALPLPNRRVICLHKSGEMSLGACHFSPSSPRGHTWTFCVVGMVSELTHWMAL